MNATSSGHVPYRTCIVCRSKRPKGELLRLVLDQDRRVIPDRRHRLPGRGAYVCEPCLGSVLKGKALSRAFRGRLQGVSPLLTAWVHRTQGDETGCQTMEDQSSCVRDAKKRPRLHTADTVAEDF
uniref:YlxR family protein n=1 Tax=Desulfacinum infernum TaxID=35837 RepID=A0A832A6A7_9BACT